MSENRTNARLKVFASVLSATLFIVPFKFAASEGRGTGAAVVLLFFVTLFFSPWAILRWMRADGSTRKQTLRLSWKMSLCAALGNIAQGLAFQMLHAGVATTFIQMNILFVALLSVLWLGEQLRWTTVIGMILAMGGIVVIQWPALSGHLEWSIGVLWAVTAALGFSCLDILSRRDAHGVDAVATNVLRAGGAMMILLWVPGAQEQIASMGLAHIGACGLAALFGPGLARLLLISASRELPAAESALIQQLRPPLAIPLTSLVFGAWPSTWEWWGSGLVATGVIAPIGWALQKRARSS